MLEIHIARPEEVPGAKQLWSLCFGDSESCVEMTFREILSWGTLIVLTIDDQVRGMTAILPCKMYLEDSPLKAGYIYGLCVHPEERNGGLATGLAQYAEFYMGEHGYRCAAVVPAEKWMEKIYRRAYFGDCFCIEKAELIYDELQSEASDDAFPVSVAEYGILREAFLEDSIHLAYGEKYLSLQERFSHMGKQGGFYRIQADGLIGCACADLLEDGTVFVRELLFDGEKNRALAALSKAIPGQKYKVRCPVSTEEGEQIGMIRIYDQETAQKWNWGKTIGYLGLPLD